MRQIDDDLKNLYLQYQKNSDLLLESISLAQKTLNKYVNLIKRIKKIKGTKLKKHEVEIKKHYKSLFTTSIPEKIELKHVNKIIGEYKKRSMVAKRSYATYRNHLRKLRKENVAFRKDMYEMVTPPYIVLTHELAHAYHHLQLGAKYGKQAKKRKKIVETYAVQIANQVRREKKRLVPTRSLWQKH